MSTINKKEIEKFSKMADEWWDPEGKFKPLHKFNPLRISYIKKKVMSHFNISSKLLPLKNIELLDIGCGGGLLSEPMCRLGARVTAIDASQKNIYVERDTNIGFKRKHMFYQNVPKCEYTCVYMYVSICSKYAQIAIEFSKIVNIFKTVLLADRGSPAYSKLFQNCPVPQIVRKLLNML